ncbi:hypothetical protein EOD42_14180 [Rhodovarius crocodyli]|uniref:Uncharacterized protein n=1 Tax=Rhodovarius crocodyli TaxID=1979269 RepID=A0A437MF59_9PROT|nr:hypothetical protein [Rhodovarius crocodyli]RVT96256.1 hypothetical protein EOD42_14180 [Rhodovarius crocodyli]
MAIDAEYYRYCAGIALVRWNGTGWSHVRWIHGGYLGGGGQRPVVFDNPGSGAKNYALWVVNGQLSTMSSVTVNKPIQLGTQLNKR